MPGELNSPYRRDPFTGDFYPRWNEADEIHQAKLHVSNGLVGFFLNESPQLRIPSAFICAVLADEYDEYGTPLRENARLDSPDADEFRVDYDADGYFGTGFVEVNASRLDEWFVVGYWGLGTPPRWETYYNARVNVSQDSAIEGDLIVGRKLAVLDEYDAEMFSAEGAVISAHGNRVRGVADAVESTDLVNKGQYDVNVTDTLAELYLQVNYLLGWMSKASVSNHSSERVVGFIDSGTRYFIAVGFDGVGGNSVMRSTDDGETWSGVSATNDYPWADVAYGGGTLVAVKIGGSDRTMRSANNGATWSDVTPPDDAATWISVAYGNGVFVAVAFSGTNRCMRSTDNGASWSNVSVTANEWRAVTFGGGYFVAVASTGTNRVMRSIDGATWEDVGAAAAESWLAVAYHDGVFVAGATSGTNRIMYSTDNGATWDIAALPDTLDITHIAGGNGVFIVIGTVGSGGVGFYRSRDGGQTWDPIMIYPTKSWSGIASVEKTFVVVARTNPQISMRNPGL